MSHGPIEEAYRLQMNAVAEALNQFLAPNGFVLLVFPFGGAQGGRVNYISNADRADMVCAMKEFIAREEGRAHDAPGVPQ